MRFPFYNFFFMKVKMFSVPDSKKHIQEYEPERVTPVYTYITKKYQCEENVISASEDSRDILNTLTFNIKENDPSMVWKSVRLCMPIVVKSPREYTNAGQVYQDFRIAGNTPACNIAFGANAFEMFSDMQLVVNGSVFTSQPNRFQGMLDRCYRGRDVLSFQSGGSLKPIVNRNLRTATEANGYYEVQRDDEKDPGFVQVHDTYSTISRNAFDLTQSNPGFITRAAKFQQALNGSSDRAEYILSMYMDIGIFQNKERKLPSGRRLYNDACPYLRDVMIRCTYDKLQSKFDSKYNKTVDGFDDFHNRDMPSKLLEFATPVNSSILGEPALPINHWSHLFEINCTEKPYLEVSFVQVPQEQLKQQYSLMALRHQHEVSDIFHFNFVNPGDDGFAKQSVTKRINSRLLEVPSKIYLWAGLSFNDKKSFFLGNTGNQRNCEISRLHLRMNTRPDALFEPTQLECYNIFKRLTLNDMNYQTWCQSPIYVFDAQALGQPEFLASNSELMTYDWSCDISPTALQKSEMLYLQDPILMDAMGYKHTIPWTLGYSTIYIQHQPSIRIRKYCNYVMNPGYYLAVGANHWNTARNLVPDASDYIPDNKKSVSLAMYVPRNVYTQASGDSGSLLSVDDPGSSPSLFTRTLDGLFLKKLDGQHSGRAPYAVQNNPEIWRMHHVLEKRVRLDNFIWCLWDHTNNRIVRNIGNDQTTFWYVPESWPFTMTFGDVAYRSGNNAYNKRAIFNSLDDLIFNADGTIRLPANVRPNPSYDENGKYIIKGSVSMTQSDGQVITRKFNKYGENPEDGSGYCPGPRAYPMAIHGAGAARTFLGIRNVGQADGGTGAGQAGNNDVLRGGLAPENWPVQAAGPGDNPPEITHQTCYKMIQASTDNGPGDQRNLYWIAFQPTYKAMHLIDDAGRALARKVAFDVATGGALPVGDFVGVDAGAALCGSISRPQSMAPVQNANDATGYIPIPQEVHILKTVIERDVAASSANLPNSYYNISGDDQGAIDNRGAQFQIAGLSVKDQTITDSLDFSLNVLYEMGNDRYVVSKNGDMIQSDATWTPTVTQQKTRLGVREQGTFSRDPRLQLPKLERVRGEPRASGFNAHY